MHWTWQEAQDTAAAHADWHSRVDAAGDGDMIVAVWTA